MNYPPKKEQLSLAIFSSKDLNMQILNHFLSATFIFQAFIQRERMPVQGSHSTLTFLPGSECCTWDA